jgi:hypothetical protein
MFDKITVQIAVDMTNPHRPYLKIDCISPPIGTFASPPISFLLFVLLTAGAFATAELLGGINAAPPPELMEEEEEDDEAEEEVEEASKSNENKKRKEPPQSPQQAKKGKAKATAGSKKGAAGNVPRPTKKHREGK